VTCSEHGSVILADGKAVKVAAEPVAAVVDTTGAGDLYAAGFLFGLTSGLDMEDCGRLGGLAAAEVIAHVGARPQISLQELATARYPALMPNLKKG
jgi:sugar/nucleoside kinase (ribokinase family)